MIKIKHFILILTISILFGLGVIQILSFDKHANAILKPAPYMNKQDAIDIGIIGSLVLCFIMIVGFIIRDESKKTIELPEIKEQYRKGYHVLSWMDLPDNLKEPDVFKCWSKATIKYSIFEICERRPLKDKNKVYYVDYCESFTFPYFSRLNKNFNSIKKAKEFVQIWYLYDLIGLKYKNVKAIF